MSDDNEKIVATERYIALGIPYPDPATMCQGQCEGLGVVPVRADDEELEYRERWTCAHNDAGVHECDGVHFVMCPDCDGTGKRPAAAIPPE